MSSKLQHKLLTYEEMPPASAWNSIATTLDGEAQSYPDKLYQFQQQPPSHIWENIQHQLEPKVQAPAARVVPLKTFRRSFKYIAAAVILLAITTVVYFTNNTANNTTAQKAVDKKTFNTVEATAVPKVPIVTNNEAGNKPDLLADNESAPTEENPAKANDKFKTLVAFKKSSIVMPEDNEPVKELAVVPKEKNIINNTTDTNRYMVVTSDMGNAVRLTKKVYSSFACADDVAYASNQDCKEKLTSLQTKMSASLATDFAGFLDLLKNLQENTN